LRSRYLDGRAKRDVHVVDSWEGRQLLEGHDVRNDLGQPSQLGHVAPEQDVDGGVLVARG
jgi:hypothetical protein